MNVLQVEALCWCGKRATHNARTVNGEMVTEGEVIVVGDVESDVPAEVAYEVLCRAHHRRRMTAARARADLDGRRAAAVRLRCRFPRSPGIPDVPVRCNARERAGFPGPPGNRAVPQPTRIGMCISRGVSEPCRPIRVIS